MQVAPGELKRRIEEFELRVKQAGVKLTHQRREIFREVAASLEHPDAEMILKAVKPRMPSVSLDTVYRTLWLLSELGLVSTLGPRRQTVRFDANLKSHHHYVCEQCGTIRDFDSAALGRLPIPAAVKALGSVTQAQVEIKGICRKCAGKRGTAIRRKNPDKEKRRPGKR